MVGYCFFVVVVQVQSFQVLCYQLGCVDDFYVVLGFQDMVACRAVCDYFSYAVFVEEVFVFFFQGVEVLFVACVVGGASAAFDFGFQVDVVYAFRSFSGFWAVQSVSGSRGSRGCFWMRGVLLVF